MARQLAVLLLLLPTVARAERPELITDRPDFTESAAAVPPRYVQAELGAQATLTDGQQVLEAPALLLRTGVVRNVELRVGAPSAVVTWAEGQDGAETDVGSLQLGAKLMLPGEGGAAGLLPFVDLPVRASHYDSVGVGVGLKAVWAVDLGPRLGLGGNLGAQLSGLGAEDVDVAWHALGSLSLGISLSERLGTFVEVFTLLDEADWQVYGHTGLTLAVTRWLQLDLHGGMLLDTPATGFVGVGAALLF